MWDGETSFYYIQSRYYLSKESRFISTDILLDIYCEILSSNSFCYCRNSPVVFYDESGYSSFGSVAPPLQSGYIPPKNGPSRVHSDFGYGWKDKDGNIWVPDKSQHGGPHWDVHRKDGKGYSNVYPDGHKRGGKGKKPDLPIVPSQPNRETEITSSPTMKPKSEKDSVEHYIPDVVFNPTRIHSPIKGEDYSYFSDNAGQSSGVYVGAAFLVVCCIALENAFSIGFKDGFLGV